MSQHVYRASMVTGNAGAGVLRDQPLRGTARTGSAAAETGYELARRTSAAYLSMGPPSSATLAARTAAIEAFLHATVNLGAATSTLASQVPSPHGHRFTAAQARLAEAGEHFSAHWNAPPPARSRPAGSRSHSGSRPLSAETPSSSQARYRRSPRPACHGQLSRFPRRTGRPAASRIRR